MEAIVLGALETGPLHGYGIVKRIREGSNGLFRLPESQLYPLLHTMQGRGWVRSEWATSESGPARKVYTIQEGGMLELESRRADFREFSAAVSALITSREGARG